MPTLTGGFLHTYLHMKTLWERSKTVAELRLFAVEHLLQRQLFPFGFALIFQWL